MLTFLDGPAAGQTLLCARAPLFLRVTHGPRGWDACDQLRDRPEPGETVHVYRKAQDKGSVHLCGRGGCRHEQIADYRLYDPQPDDATLRDTAKWRAWAVAEKAKNNPQETHR